MPISTIQPHLVVSQQAYSRANLFDDMKKGKKTGPDPAVQQQAKISLETEQLPSVQAPEKPKPNSIPFKAGFVFEYTSGSDNTPIAITISDRKNVKVEARNGVDISDRRKMIRGLVLMGFGELARADFNERYGSEDGGMDRVRQEITGMGLNPDLPFGLGDRAFYFTAKNALNEYKPVDIQG
ncbi:MAG: hypothetical protein A2268_05345 [Candidatus Raymondbacteria bacterium RifOxyA12_full_50_37]|uniref:Uncharacterized protein n=1 Tax=Candidatus Raymondbacteria bacterium RIFOXYD12_FULL_49_13 TaxID=1817890 RepID=A0A1F7FBG9_UNCRA|nr:MAG: hypothetical protein A2268_05345 [Candidatus Raymondbacteria bacterium RifOxyA12_full_50_37]OGJ88989.1 MAG: hypothetical protein A2248_02580 [Candidatus Raymondbacteria bacterium RIFOXYA2_FULL_49_16]OGJ92498.1 MAG: hypothetical protein A2350_15725 [Candidatus Raymondbacteria bacterium RifOxyB12_full_50_8]OGJ97017.1 MAG: hypothetical protein A2453_04000 [Candidatus Raymondbacteria bacterium RIFOXYC2_FULL_50_21]OGK02561.1 MAG: hypothetical protein A2487_15070 [Candidatus Raymondbacteria b